MNTYSLSCGRLLMLAAMMNVALFATIDEVRVIRGQSAPIRIQRDPDGVPHIRAATELDAIFGLGYIHAHDRLWQMEYQRRIGNGRLAEILGPPALPVDTLFRTVGLHRAAAATWAAYPQADRAPLNAYVSGINAYLTSRADRRLPIEFAILGIEPELWRPEDVIAVSKVLSWSQAGNWEHELLRLQLIQKVGPERASQLMPVYTDDGPTIIEQDDRTTPRAPSQAVPELPPALPGLLALHRAIVHQFGIGGDGFGSNSWVLAGSRTSTGKPILAGDPHVSTQAPSPAYLAHIKGGELDVIGGTTPGRPDFLVGHNGRISWAISNSNTDLQDLYFEHVNQQNQVEYKGGWEPLQIVTETVKVKGGKDVVFKVRISRHGPLISDIINPAGPPIALRWTELNADEDGGIRAFLGVNRARNWQEFTAALRFNALHENVIYGDVDGNIGYQLSATVPVRARGDGTMPVPGWTGEYEWSGYVPYERLPRVLNPKEGFIVTANNKIIGDHYPYRISNNYAAPFRAMRILEMINARQRHSADDVAAMQSDILAVHARELLPILLRTKPVDDRGWKALEMLRDWDARTGVDSAEAAIFEAWYIALGRHLFADELGDSLWNSYADNIYMVGMALREAVRKQTAWCDDVRTPATESCDAVIATSLSEGLDQMTRAQGTAQLDRWQWGRVHPARFPHAAFDKDPERKHLFSRSIPNGGDKYTVNVGSTFVWETYEQLHGAAYRQVVDFSDLSNSRFIISPGQSGDPHSPEYDRLMPLWQRGDYIPMRYFWPAEQGK